MEKPCNREGVSSISWSVTDPLLPRDSLNEFGRDQRDSMLRPPLRHTSRGTVSTLAQIQFLASWGIRSTEFSMVLFLATAFPGRLFYVSGYGLVRSLSAILFSSWIGAYVDLLNRLRAIRMSIIFQRIPVAMSCVIFISFPWFHGSELAENLAFAVLVLLACLEKLASIANVVAIERDWIIVIAEVNNIRK